MEDSLIPEEELKRMEAEAAEQWEKANAFFYKQGGVNPTPFIMGYKAAAKAEYLRSRKEVGWISVKDRLPKWLPPKE